MARRRTTTTRMSPPAATPATETAGLSTFEKEVNDALIKQIMANLGPDMLAFETKSMFSTSVKYADGSWKTKAIDQGEDFALRGLRMGARGEFIFEFRPIDAKEYAQMELPEGKVFGVFEGFEQMIVTALGLIAAPKTASEHFGKTAYTWATGKAHWRTMERKRSNESNLMKRARDAAAAVEARKQEDVAKKETEDAYSGNPAYGSW